MTTGVSPLNGGDLLGNPSKKGKFAGNASRNTGDRLAGPGSDGNDPGIVVGMDRAGWHGDVHPP